MVNQQFNDSERRNPIISLFQSNTAKIIMVCMLTLGLLIPLEFVKDLIRERAARKHDVVQEVNQMWESDNKFQHEWRQGFKDTIQIENRIKIL